MRIFVYNILDNFGWKIMVGFSSSKTVGSMAARKDVRNRIRIGLYPSLLLLSLLIATFLFFWSQQDDMSDNITPTNTYTPSTYTSDDFTATNNNTVTITPSEEASAAPSAPPQPYDKDIVVNHGDTLSSLLLSQNIQTQDVLAILALPLVQHSLVRIHPGQIFTIHVDANQSLTSLTYDISAAQTLSVIKQNDSFDAKITKKPTKVLPTIAAGVITSTFYDAGLAQHLPQKIILDASRIFASKINFKRGLQPGDHFKVIYESSYVGNKAIGTGNIFAIKLCALCGA